MRPRRLGPGVADHVAPEDQAVGIAADADAGGLARGPVVLDRVFLQAIAMGGHAEGLVAEEDAVLAVQTHAVSPQEVVGVLVADRDAETPVLLQQVVFERAESHPPAEEQAVFAVAPGDAPTHRGALRPAAGMDAQRGVVFAEAIDDAHVVRLLEADPVAVEIADGAALDDRPKRAIEEDPRPATAVEVDVRLPIAVDRQTLHPHALQIVAADDRKDGRRPGVVADHAVGPQRSADGQRVAALAGDARDGRVEPSGAIVPNGHAAPRANPRASSSVICSSPKSPSSARGVTAPSALRRTVLPRSPRTVTFARRWSESCMRYSPSPISTTPPPSPAM